MFQNAAYTSRPRLSTVCSTTVPRNRLVRLAISAVKTAGFAPTVVEGKGYSVVWFDGIGQKHHVAVARSTRTHFQEKTVLNNVRRTLRVSVSLAEART